MSTFIEVQSIEKKCPVLINLDHVVEVAPLTNGTCELVLNDGSSGVNAKSVMRVKESYDLFKQFAMHTITVEDIEKRFPKTASTTKKKGEKERHVIGFDDIPKL
jgi:hypothetical protein